VAKFMLSQAVQAAGFKAVMVGEGADEAFFGYAHLERDYLLQAGTTGAGLLEKLDRRHTLQAGVMMPLGPDVTDQGAVPTFLAAKLGIGSRMRPLLEPSFRETLSKTPGEDLRRHFASQLDERHPVTQSAYLWSKLALASYILRTLGDGTEMAHSVEGRVPFLDHRLFETARRISPEVHLHGGAKRLLRDAMRGVVPERIRLREKRPLLAPPIDFKADRRARELVFDVVGSRTFKNVPFFDSARVLRWLESLESQTGPDRQAAEPVLMMILSAWALQKQFRLGRGGI
jgi:asparagine synthase (glutamine-hydrolysing)